MFSMAKRLFVEESGMEMIEWALVAVLFALVAGTGFGLLAGNVGTALTNIGTKLTTTAG